MIEIEKALKLDKSDAHGYSMINSVMRLYNEDLAKIEGRQGSQYKALNPQARFTCILVNKAVSLF